LSALLVLAAAGSTLAGAASSEVARAADEGSLAGASQTITETQTPDGVVTTTSEPERLGAWLGEIVPTWPHAMGTTGDDALYDVVASGLRTIYAVGVKWNGSDFDLHLVKYVNGAPSWERLYDGPAHGYDRGLAVAARGSVIYTAGRRDPAGADEGDILLIRWGAAGNRVWTRTYDSGSQLFDQAVDVAVDGDGNVTVVGVSQRPASQYDWVVVSYKADGTRRYVQRFDGPAHLNDEPSQMLLDPAGGIYVAGYSASATNGTDAFLIKYSKAGARLWARRYNGSGNGEDRAVSMRARPGDGVYVAGWTYRTATGQDALLLAYTASGSRLFATPEVGFGTGTSAQAFNDLEVLPNGHIICGGYDHWSGTMDRFQAQYLPTGAEHMRAVTNSDYSESITAMAKDRQGGVYFTGTWGTATGAQVLTTRMCAGGGEWVSHWPAIPAASYSPTAIAVNGVNAYIVGWSISGGFDEFALGHVY
jgi:hypothetical protein